MILFGFSLWWNIYFSCDYTGFSHSRQCKNIGLVVFSCLYIMSARKYHFLLCIYTFTFITTQCSLLNYMFIIIFPLLYKIDIKTFLWWSWTFYMLRSKHFHHTFITIHVRVTNTWFLANCCNLINLFHYINEIIFYCWYYYSYIGVLFI